MAFTRLQAHTFASLKLVLRPVHTLKRQTRCLIQLLWNHKVSAPHPLAPLKSQLLNMISIPQFQNVKQKILSFHQHYVCVLLFYPLRQVMFKIYKATHRSDMQEIKEGLQYLHTRLEETESVTSQIFKAVSQL